MTVETSKSASYAVIRSIPEDELITTKTDAYVAQRTLPDDELITTKTDAYVAQRTLPDDELVVTKHTVYVVLKPVSFASGPFITFSRSDGSGAGKTLFGGKTIISPV